MQPCHWMSVEMVYQTSVLVPDFLPAITSGVSFIFLHHHHPIQLSEQSHLYFWMSSFPFLDSVFVFVLALYLYLRVRCREFLYNSCPYICTAFLIIHIPHQSGTFATTEEPPLTHHCHPKSRVYIRVYFWCCMFYAFGHMYPPL